jgi:hypothetical protein
VLPLAFGAGWHESGCMGVCVRGLSAALAALLLLTIARGPGWAQSAPEAGAGAPSVSVVPSTTAVPAGAVPSGSAAPAGSGSAPPAVPAAPTATAPAPGAKHQGRLVVDTDASGQIFVDDQPMGQAHWEGAVDAGKHRVRVSGPGMRSRDEEVEIVEQGTHRVELALEHEPGVPWLIIGGGVVLFIGTALLAYVLMRPSEKPPEMVGSVGTSQQGLTVRFR